MPIEISSPRSSRSSERAPPNVCHAIASLFFFFFFVLKKDVWKQEEQDKTTNEEKAKKQKRNDLLAARQKMNYGENRAAQEKRSNWELDVEWKEQQEIFGMQ